MLHLGKEEIKTSLFVDDMILYFKNTKDSTRILRMIYTFNRVAGYKINIQKQQLFYTAKTNLLKKKLGKQFHSNSIKISKILKINQDAKKLCNENCKSLKKEIVKDTRKWKNFLFS
jgi:hypothetical protein